MLAPLAGRVAVVLCNADAAAAARHADDRDHSGHRHSQSDPACPYAQSAGPAPLPSLPLLALAPTSSEPALQLGVSQTHSSFGPTRQAPPRGPPLLT
jgi:DUF2946 family protein